MDQVPAFLRLGDELLGETKQREAWHRSTYLLSSRDNQLRQLVEPSFLEMRHARRRAANRAAGLRAMLGVEVGATAVMWLYRHGGPDTRAVRQALRQSGGHLPAENLCHPVVQRLMGEELEHLDPCVLDVMWAIAPSFPGRAQQLLLVAYAAAGVGPLRRG